MDICPETTYREFVSSRRTAHANLSHSGQNDRRVQKTVASLREALHSLIREKPYDEIVVKEILDRANVGRSTFYTHFRDKDELLASSIENIVNSARAVPIPRSGKINERLLWFGLPIFEYHARQRAQRHGAMSPAAARVLHEQLRIALIKMIDQAVGRDVRGARADLVVQLVASNFILVFRWWLEQKNPLPPAEADKLFRRLVQPMLGAF